MSKISLKKEIEDLIIELAVLKELIERGGEIPPIYLKLASLELLLADATKSLYKLETVTAYDYGVPRILWESACAAVALAFPVQLLTRVATALAEQKGDYALAEVSRKTVERLDEVMQETERLFIQVAYYSKENTEVLH